LETTLYAPQKNAGAERILKRELDHTFLCEHTIKLLASSTNLGRNKIGLRNREGGITESKDDINDGVSNKNEGNGLLSLNVGPEADRLDSTPDIKTGDRTEISPKVGFSPVSRNKAHIDCSIVYSPNG